MTFIIAVLIDKGFAMFVETIEVLEMMVEEREWGTEWWCGSEERKRSQGFFIVGPALAKPSLAKPSQSRVVEVTAGIAPTCDCWNLHMSTWSGTRIINDTIRQG